ncbi:hypothetical protein SeMB42_g01796 [Synchytrium endobioticum]|uniref:Uncharacterized protein n=1 Tax=Synchytrium endobioticum TaxID=286115 RepID=A0A507DJR5_9FUNG|nr:hypothetical protein SeMB42_g01796 [Synchytrium endobioticum]
MSKHFIIVLLLFQVCQDGFADPEDPDVMLKKHAEAIRGERWRFSVYNVEEDIDLTKKVEALRPVLMEASNADATILVPLVINHMMEPLDVSFTEADVRSPAAEMSLAYLEFCWEALSLASHLLQDVTGLGVESVETLNGEYWLEMCKRVGDAAFGSPTAIEYSPDISQEINWPSVNMVLGFQVLETVKALESLKASDESPVSSLTEAYVFLNGVPFLDGPVFTTSESGLDLYSRYKNSDSPEHLAYCIRYLKIVAQRVQFVVVACSRFLRQRQKNRCLQEKHIIDIRKHVIWKKWLVKSYIDDISSLQEKLLACWVNMPREVKKHLQEVTSRIVKLKAETSANSYPEAKASAKIKDILVAHPLNFLREDTGVPSEVISMFELIAPGKPYEPHLQTSPYMALAAEYHLLLLWRCMQRLSLLKWFKNYYDIELLHDSVATVERVNEVENDITGFARHVLEMFDFYENTAQPRIFRMSEQERKLARELLNLDDIHLASTWEKIIGANAAKYIVAADQAEKKIKNSGSWSPIQQVDEIPLRVNSLIQAFPEDIYNPGSSSRVADGEFGFGMRSSAHFEGGSSSRSSLNYDTSGDSPPASYNDWYRLGS